MKTEHEIASTQANEASETLATASTTPAALSTAKAKTKASRAAKPIKGVKLPKQPKAAKQSPKPSKEDNEPTDRLPSTLAELKETKSGLVATLFLGGKDKDGIAKELKTAFKLTEAQAVKITRRITGRIRLYQRIFELVTAKK